jgi:hypothetical protein
MHSRVEKNPDVRARKRRNLVVFHSCCESQGECFFTFVVVKWLAVSAGRYTCPCWRCWRKWAVLLALTTVCTESFRRRFSAVSLLSVWLLSSALLRCVLTRKILKGDSQTDWVGSELQAQSDSYQRLYWHNLSLLLMSTMCSKHVES